MKVSLVLVTFALAGLSALPAAQGSTSLSCENLFWNYESHSLEIARARDKSVAKINPKVWTWAERERTRLTPIAPQILARMRAESVATVVLGGSSIHTILPESNASAKLYFAHGGPRNFDDLTQLIVDAAEPVLKDLTQHSRPGRDLILYVPAPGEIQLNGESIKLPANFGPLGGHVYALPEMVQKELRRRAEASGKHDLAQVKVFVKNDSYPLSAQIGSTHLDGQPSRAKLIFAGTGLGESNIVRHAEGRFDDYPTEMGHLKLSSWPELKSMIPSEILSAAERLQRLQGKSDIEFENLVAGGRSGNHLSGILTLLFQAQGVPVHPADQGLAKKISLNTWLMLEDVTSAATGGGPIARKMLDQVIETQAIVAGVMATAFGETPSGFDLPAGIVYSSSKNNPVDGREVYIRADGAFLSWTHNLALAKQSFRRSVEFQIHGASSLQVKLKGAGIDPSSLRTKNFVLIYGAQGVRFADPDLSCLATISRRAFTND